MQMSSHLCIICGYNSNLFSPLPNSSSFCCSQISTLSPGIYNCDSCKRTICHKCCKICTNIKQGSVEVIGTCCSKQMELQLELLKSFEESYLSIEPEASFSEKAQEVDRQLFCTECPKYDEDAKTYAIEHSSDKRSETFGTRSYESLVELIATCCADQHAKFAYTIIIKTLLRNPQNNYHEIKFDRFKHQLKKTK